MSFLQGVAFAKGPEGWGSEVYHRKGTAWGTCVSQGVRYRCREVAARTWTPHSLWPGIPGGVSASATGSHRRLLRQGERCATLRRVLPAVLPEGSLGEGAEARQPPRRLWRQSQKEGIRDDAGAGQEGREVRDARETPQTTPRLRADVLEATEKPCAATPRDSHATRAG